MLFAGQMAEWQCGLIFSEFLETRYAFITEFFNNYSKDVIRYIVRYNFRPPLITQEVLSSRDQRSRVQSNSIKVPSQPSNQAISKPYLRATLLNLKRGIYSLRRLYEPPSVGQSPATIPPSILPPPNTSLGNSAGNSRNSEGNSGNTIRVTSIVTSVDKII